MSKITDSAPSDKSCINFDFAEVEVQRTSTIPQPRLVVRFADGLQILLCDHSDITLAAELIASLRLIQRRHEKGTTQ